MADKQAFPVPAHPNYPRIGPSLGMTLREYYAGQALVGVMQWWPVDHEGRAITDRDLLTYERTKLAVATADALVAQLERTPKP